MDSAHREEQTVRKSSKRLKTAELLTQGLWELGGGGGSGGMFGSREISYNNTILDTLWQDSRKLIDPLPSVVYYSLEPLSLSPP